MDCGLAPYFRSQVAQAEESFMSRFCIFLLVFSYTLHLVSRIRGCAHCAHNVSSSMLLRRGGVSGSRRSLCVFEHVVEAWEESWNRIFEARAVFWFILAQTTTVDIQ